MGSVMNFDKILQKPFLISVFVFNIILFGVIVFLLGYVQNLLDSDSRNNLEEIVSQNKNVITSKLLLDLNRLDIISNKISDGLKNKNITKEADINKFLDDYSKNSIDDSLFLANKNGLAYVDGDTHIDISGRRYFNWLLMVFLIFLNGLFQESTANIFLLAACRCITMIISSVRFRKSIRINR